MSNENVVLVTGGTGSQGGATVTHLLAAKRVRVAVLTRNLESPKAKSLVARGVELVKGDFEDVVSLRTALAGEIGFLTLKAIGLALQVRQICESRRESRQPS